MDELLLLSAAELALRIREREVTSVAVVEAHLSRIEAVDPALNALVASRAEAALAEARQADRFLATSALPPPLLGVPFTCKEMIQVDGMPLTFGCRSRADRRADGDAAVVARLRGAGAIPLGVTNVPEWGMWFETYNHVYGRTNNPWDVRRTPGGSSGGEGAIVGAGGSPFGIGSDIGGSVRMPAAFCGVFGHKPTAGLLPLTGHFPVYASGPDASLPRRAPYVTIGTLTRSARDILPLLEVMRGTDGIDPNAEDLGLVRDAVAWAGRRVVLLADPDLAMVPRTDVCMREASQRAAGHLAARGAEVHEAPRRLLHRAGDAWFAALQETGGVGFAESLGAGTPVRLLPELLLSMAGRGTYSWPALFFCLGERFGRRSERRVRMALEELERMSAAMHELLGDGGVLIMPPHPRTAPRHNAPVLRPLDYIHTAALNTMRVPATVAPAGFSAGLPVSVQFAAARGHDHLTIAAASVMEEEGARWRPAPVLTRAPGA